MLRMGLIGCGGMQNVFARGLPQLASRVTVTATADVDIARARAAAELFDDARAVNDFRDMLDDVDAVLIAVPHHLHHPVALECLAADKHVLLEKPMANTERQCLDLIETAERTRRVLMIGYVMRYHRLFGKLKELIDDGLCGDVFQMSIWTEQYTRGGDDAWYHCTKTVGGGQLFSHGCHYIDLLMWYLGRPVEGTHLGTNFGTPWMEAEGTSNVAMKFESGALGYHFGTWGAKGTRLGYSVHAHGTNGMLELHFASGRIILHADPTGGDLPTLLAKHGVDAGESHETVLYELPVGKHTNWEVEHFLDCVESGAEPETNGRQSLQSLRVIWRLYDAEQRRSVADLHGLGLDQFSDSQVC